jgi:hypothetical protein
MDHTSSHTQTLVATAKPENNIYVPIGCTSFRINQPNKYCVSHQYCSSGPQKLMQLTSSTLKQTDSKINIRSRWIIHQRCLNDVSLNSANIIPEKGWLNLIVHLDLSGLGSTIPDHISDLLRSIYRKQLPLVQQIPFIIMTKQHQDDQ